MSGKIVHYFWRSVYIKMNRGYQTYICDLSRHAKLLWMNITNTIFTVGFTHILLERLGTSTKLRPIYCQLNHQENISVKRCFRYINFHSRKCTWKYRLQKGGNLFSNTPTNTLFPPWCTWEREATMKTAIIALYHYILNPSLINISFRSHRNF